MLALARNGQIEEAVKLAEGFLAKENLDNEFLMDVARAFCQCAVASSEPAAREQFLARARRPSPRPKRMATGTKFSWKTRRTWRRLRSPPTGPLRRATAVE